MSARIALVKIFSELSTFFSHESDEQELEDYLDIFKDYDILSILSAIKSHKKNIKEGMFFPKPAHLLKYIGSNVIQFPYHKEFAKIKHGRRSSVETAEKFMKEIRDILRKT